MDHPKFRALTLFWAMTVCVLAPTDLIAQSVATMLSIEIELVRIALLSIQCISCRSVTLKYTSTSVDVQLWVYHFRPGYLLHIRLWHGSKRMPWLGPRARLLKYLYCSHSLSDLPITLRFQQVLISQLQIMRQPTQSAKYPTIINQTLISSMVSIYQMSISHLSQAIHFTDIPSLVYGVRAIRQHAE